VPSFHDDVQNNVRGVINRFLGPCDGNPASLIPPSPGESAPLFVGMIGGSAEIVAKGSELITQSKYLHATGIRDRPAFAEPSTVPARELPARAFEQIG
jgi:alkyl sulfatase BDS1-like metallo-beta-lactamase superfamily hydrolase